MSKIKNAFIKLRIVIKQWSERHKLKFTDFTIISNNCWAGTAVYQPFGLKYNTPTVGLFIMDEDYMRMLENLDYYLSLDLRFIAPKDSKYYNKISNNGKRGVTYPIALLGDDVEIHFLHYHSQEEAQQKWQRRCKRINKNRILIKMSLRDSGYDQDEMVNRFLKLNYLYKICFVPESVSIKSSNLIMVPELSHLNLVGGDETQSTLKHINVYELLNSIQ